MAKDNAVIAPAAEEFGSRPRRRWRERRVLERAGSLVVTVFMSAILVFTGSRLTENFIAKRKTIRSSKKKCAREE